MNTSALKEASEFLESYACDKEIYTNGIDGGQGRHPSFEGTHQKYTPNYDAQFEIERELLEKYGAKVTRI